MRTTGFLLAVVASLACAAPAQAVTFTVTGGADGAGSCAGTSCTTIRAALVEASRLSGPDTIALPARAYQVNQGQLVVNSAVTITGASAATTSLTGDGKSGRIFNVGADQQVTISHVTISSGAAISSADGDGGNLRVNNGATLLLDHVRVTDGLALRGGGIAMTTGTRVTITRSLIDSNVTTGSTGAPSREGGALIVLGNPQLAANVLQISDTTIADNDSSQGPGIVLRGNSADSAVLDRVTIARNVAGTNSVGAGIGNPAAANVRIGSSIVAFNTGDGTPVQCDVKPTSTGGNIDTGTSCGFSGPADRSSTDPQISAVLTVAGGETPVLTIPATSPAVDIAPNCNQADQRDLSRPQGKSCDSGAYEFDQVADTAITAGPNNPGNDTTPTFSFIADEPGATFQCRVDSATFVGCSPPHTTAPLAPGSHTFEVRAIDSGGNTDPTPASQTFVVDTAPPDTNITNGPSGSVSSTSAAFTFTSTESGSTFQCALDGAAFGACPVSYTGLAQGSHTFQVRATDAAGNPDTTPASRTWTVDTVAPDTTIGTGPTGAVSSTSATFTFTSNEAGATFQCALDGAAFGACPVSYTGLSQGSHTFQVRATDTAGNPDASPASRTWTVDTVAPDTTINTGPTGAVSSTSATFTFGSNEAGATFACSLDGAAFGACPAGYTGLSQGAHTFAVRATDAAGNPDTTPASRTWTVDTVAPDTTINTGPSGAVSSTSATFTFSSNEAGATFACSLDGAAFGACPAGYTGLSQGSHTFAVRATDAAGNPDSTPAARTFVVDTTAPNAPVVTSPNDNALLITNTVAFNGTAEPGTTVELREGATLRGSAVASGTGNWTIVMGAVTDGTHTYAARAIDAATNTSTPTTRTVTVDTGLPDTTIATGPSGPVSDATPTFTFTSEPGATFECSIDGVAHTACPTPFTTATLSQGAHTLSVRAVDPAGNRDNTPATRNFTVDTVAPDTTINTGPINSVSSTAATFTFSSTEAGSSFQCALDGAAFGACPVSYTGLSQGSHTFQVRATDAAGNPDGTPATRTWTVDTQAPATPAITSPADGTVLGTQTVTLSGTAEANSTVEILEGTTSRGTTAATAGGTWSRQLTSVPEGSHTYTATARDAAGNVSGPSAGRTVIVDTGAPSAPVVTAGPNGPIKTAAVEFRFTGEAGATFECALDGGDLETCTSPKSYSGLAETNHVFGVRQIDAAGNASDTTTRSFTVDLTPPSVPAVVSGPEGATTNPSPAFGFNSDAGTLVECRLDGPSGPGSFQTCASPLSFSGLAPGDYTLFIRSTDAAGNSQTSQRSFTITTVQAAQTPTPTPTATPSPTPVPQQSVVVGPASGTVLVKVKGSNRFEALDVTKGIPLGSEVDVRRGRVTLTAIGRRGASTDKAEFYDGMFVVTQSGGITDLKLSEPLDCAKRAKASQKKPKKRRLWGKGTGKFRTTGSYSAATVRGTTWLVEDTCTTTLTRVTQGVVSVRDKVKRKNILVKKGKKYTARKRR